MRKYIAILSLVFFNNCSEPQPVSEEESLYLSGTIFAADSANQEYFDGIIVELLFHEQDSLRSDTTDANGFFNFNNLDRGNYTLSINNKAVFPFDSTFYLSSYMNLELILPKKVDYFPLAVNNEWLYKYDYYVKSNNDCVGVPYKKYYGFKKWIVKKVISDSLFEISETFKFTELSPELDNIGCVIKYDTLESKESQSTFFLKELANSRLVGSTSTDLFKSSVIKRFQTADSPTIIEFYGVIENSSNLELGELKIDTGLIFYYYTFGLSTHHTRYYSLHLIDKNLN